MGVFSSEKERDEDEDKDKEKETGDERRRAEGSEPKAPASIRERYTHVECNVPRLAVIRQPETTQFT